MRAFVQARAATPLSFRSEREETLGYVPGSALWGGLARAHSQLRPGRRDQFAEFFLTDRISFGNLYPSRFSQPEAKENPVNASRDSVFPAPRTAMTCKRFGGFRFHSAEDRDRRDGVWDSLVAWASFALSEGSDATLLDDLRDCRAAGCGEPLDRFASFCRRGSGADEWASTTAKIGFYTRNGIDRNRLSAHEGILFNRRFLHERSEFFGEWTIEDSLADEFEEFLGEAADGFLRVGNTRTRGLGGLSLPLGLIRRGTEREEARAEQLAARTRAFDAHLRNTLGARARHAFYLAVLLVSDCIIKDAAGRFCLQVTPEVLLDEWGLGEAQLVYLNAGRRLVRGWNSLWGLPKSEQWAVAMGSVFLYGLDSEPDWEQLARAESQGLGLRRNEGFGAVRISDAFHLEVAGA